MKRIVLCTIALLLISGAVGCTKEELRVGEITADTMVARANGELQVATVEAFDKDYYNLEELKRYIQEQVDTYNTKAGGEKITVDDVDKKENNAVMILTYSGMDQYSSFNEVPAAYFSGGVENISLKLPSTLVNAKDGSLASTDEILKDEKYRILVLNEPYHIIVDGKIKYYSEKATLVDDNEIDGTAEDMTIVVFKK
ncbi:MAG TPA: hypothetical protein GXX75_19850 [Clostridiales bacterium]|nr:hypothetical protein [Clostridiales bacterium]